MTYPTELIAKAKYEIDIFERPSAETSIELVAESNHSVPDEA